VINEHCPEIAWLLPGICTSRMEIYVILLKYKNRVGNHGGFYFAKKER